MIPLNNKRQIAVITAENDAHLPYVQKHLDEPVLVIDQSQIIKGLPVSFSFKDGESTMFYDGQELRNISAVWYRKPSPFSVDDLPVDAIYKQYSLDGLKRFASNIEVQFQDALWISEPHLIRRASNKTLQMQEAYALGFQIPRTLATSSSEAARDFISAVRPAIVKSFSGIMPVKTVFPTTKINPTSPPRLEGLPFAPAIFQAAIEPKLDLRVIVVGDEIFPAAIADFVVERHPQMRDSRFLSYVGKNSFTAYDELDPMIKKRCIDLVKRLGLKFGAIDLIVDTDGIVWFLEINPNGQWAFIEYDTGQPIGKAVARMLAM